MNLPELVTAYVRNLDASTAEQHEVVLSLIERCFGQVPTPAELFDRAKLGEFQEWLRTNPYAERFGKPLYRSPATVNQKMGVVLCWWDDAFAEGHTDSRPPSPRARGKLRLKIPKRSPKAWTEAEFRDILRHIVAAPECPEWNRHHLEALLQTVYYTGARINGVLACSLDHLTDTYLYLPAEDSKTDEEKPCQIPAWLVARLRSLSRPPNDRRLFPLPYTLPTLRGHLKRVLTAAGLPAGRRDLFHKIRRTSGTAVAKAAGMEAAREHLGHSTSATTLAYVDRTQTEPNKLQWLPDLRR
jgi:integrase